MKIIIVPNCHDKATRHYYISKALIDKGHEVHYAMWALPYKMSTRDLLHHLVSSLIPKQYQYNGITMHRISRLPYFWPYINGWLFKYQVRRLYKRLGADIIFTESYTNETEVPKDLPFVYDLEDDYVAPAEVYGSPIYKLAFRLLGVRSVVKGQCKNALAVTAVSDILCRYAKQFNKTVVKLSNGVDTQIIKGVLASKTTYPTNQHSMMYVTQFSIWSRAIETLQATVELRKEFPDIELTLVGKGIEVSKMKRFIQEHNAEDYIHYMGFIGDRKALFTLMNKSAIGLNISDKNKLRDAAHPLKVIEYSAMGKKVVSTDLVEVKALGFPNIFIFSGKKNGLKDALGRALKTKKGYKDYKDVSDHVLDDYNWEVVADKLVVLFKSSLDKDIRP